MLNKNAELAQNFQMTEISLMWNRPYGAYFEPNQSQTKAETLVNQTWQILSVVDDVNERKSLQ